MRSPDAEQSARCTASTCTCAGFQPGSVQLRSCDRCGHGWVAHALEKLQAQPPSSCGPVEVALPGLVFDLSSLVLYGAQAVPVRLKILLDRLYSVLTPGQVGHILHTLGWSLGDYVRGYMLQHPGGKALDRWLTATPGEELLILQQFLRFGETRPIVELMTLQCLAAANQPSDPELNPAPKSGQSNISTLESAGGDSGLDGCCFQSSSPADRSHAVHQNFTGGLSLLLPLHFPGSTFHCLAPPTKELLPPTKPKLAERRRQEGRRRERENGRRDIKDDPDEPNQGWSLRQQDPCFHGNRRDLPRAKQENSSPPSPSLNSPHVPTSPSLHPSISSSSSSPPNISQKSQGSSSSSSYTLSPLPSFSSSFLCPLPTSSFSSSLHRLPSSLLSLSSLSGRKGRVCCGVCGKSFYDKGTLKIHYNAVHLKIKHGCTVAGCTMVFSSLRSRNRHSANPNPRLHTHRNTHTETHKDAHGNMRNSHTHVGLNPRQGCRDDTPPPSPHPVSQTLRRDPHQIVSLSDSAYRSAPPPPPPLLPARSASLLGSPPSLAPLVVPAVEKTKHCRHLFSLHTNHTAPAPLPGPAPVTTATCDSQPVSRDCGVPEETRGDARTGAATSRQRWWESGDPPKKKPRKSCKPVKIEREKVGGRRNEDEEEC